MTRTEVLDREARQFKHHRAGTVVGQTLELESDGTEDLRVPGCASISDRHEHTAEDALVEFHTIFLPKLLEGPLGVG